MPKLYLLISAILVSLESMAYGFCETYSLNSAENKLNAPMVGFINSTSADFVVFKFICRQIAPFNPSTYFQIYLKDESGEDVFYGELQPSLIFKRSIPIHGDKGDSFSFSFSVRKSFLKHSKICIGTHWLAEKSLFGKIRGEDKQILLVGNLTELYEMFSQCRSFTYNKNKDERLVELINIEDVTLDEWLKGVQVDLIDEP